MRDPFSFKTFSFYREWDYNLIVTVRVSELDTYMFCPRKVYFESLFGENQINEGSLVREIYYQWRIGEKDPVTTALEKTGIMSGEKSYEAGRDYDHILNLLESCAGLTELKQVEYDLLITSEKLGLTGIVDEIVRKGDEIGCLILRKRPPENGVWKSDRIKYTALKMMLEDNGYSISEGYVYYWDSGILRKADTGFHERRQVVRIVERIRKIKNGFLPEGVSDRRCMTCIHRESCEIEGVSFRARFF